MISTAALRSAVDAARTAGAAAADAYHRLSRTRFVVKEPDGRLTHGTRLQEGLAVRAWPDAGAEGACGFAAGSGESETVAVALGERAAAAARGLSPVDAPQPGSTGEAVAGTVPSPPTVADFDAAVLRATPAEMTRLLGRFEAACGAVRRPGLLWALGVELHLAVIESRLVRADGELLTRRASLASAQVRFPSAFGLGRLEIVTRRLAALDSTLLARMLAPYPVAASVLPRVWVDPAGTTGSPLTLALAPPATAAVAVVVARQAARRGAPLHWAAPATLTDEPLIDWGPGSVPWDAAGRPVASVRLAGPAGESPATGGAGAPAGPGRLRLPMMRTSVRERPVGVPTNLVLADLPADGGGTGGRRLHLLEMIAARDEGWLARGVLQEENGDRSAVLVRLAGQVGDLFRGDLRAGSLRACFAAGAFVSAPELVLPAAAIVER
ncbi:MAG: hypothetical protein ACE5IK_12950 [Acidobacteriota bacterium]